MFMNEFNKFLTNTTENDNVFSSYDPLVLTPVIASIVVVTMIIAIIVFYYYFSIRKLEANQVPKGFALLIFILVNYSKKLVFEVLGHKFIKLTPYFLMLFLYILVSNLIGMTGFENPTSSVTVTLSMGLVTFLGTFIFGFKYQRLSYLKRFLIGININSKKTNKKRYVPLIINPLEVIGNFTPLISISMRLWGNIFGGSIIMALLYAIPMAINGNNPLLSQPYNAYAWQLCMFIPAVPFNLYLDVLAGSIQALIFVLLTMVYWKMSLPDDGNENSNYSFVDYNSECCVKLKTISRV